MTWEQYAKEIKRQSTHSLQTRHVEQLRSPQIPTYSPTGWVMGTSPGNILQRSGRVRVDRQVLGHAVVHARVDEVRVEAHVVHPVHIRHDHLAVLLHHTVQETVPVLGLTDGVETNLIKDDVSQTQGNGTPERRIDESQAQRSMETVTEDIIWISTHIKTR